MSFVIGFVKFCLMMVGNTVMAVATVLDAVAVVIALAIILDNKISPDLWKRKER